MVNWLRPDLETVSQSRGILLKLAIEYVGGKTFYSGLSDVVQCVLVSVQPPCNTRPSSSVTISRPSSSSSLKITNRSFRFASPHLWNQLPVSFRQSTNQSPSHSPSFIHGSSCT